jgi:predicted CxxxxCH...CXXCH cytochrome family protein
MLFAGKPLDAGVSGSPHDFSKSNSLYITSPLLSGGSCSICHTPHGSQPLESVLWPRALSEYRSKLTINGTGNVGSKNYIHGSTLLCYDCHDDHLTSGKINNLPDFTKFANYHKPQNIAFGFSKGGTVDSDSTMKEDGPGGGVAGYYENNPPFDAANSFGVDVSLDPSNSTAIKKTGGHYFKTFDPGSGFRKGDKLPCSDCHNPHESDGTTSKWQAFIRKNWPGEINPIKDRLGTEAVASSYMANLPLSGYATDRKDHESRKLCAMCHGYSESQDNTSVSAVSAKDINLAYSPTPIVRPTNREEHKYVSSGGVACVSCHTHNSVEISCTQCHGYPPPGYPEPPNWKRSMVPQAYDNASDSHPKHSTGYNMPCKMCHAGAPHYSDNVQVAFDPVWSSGKLVPAQDNCEQISQTPLFLGGTACWNLYCHSSGRINRSSAADNQTARWGIQHDQVRCNSCHGAFPNDNTNGDFVADNTSMRYGAPNYTNRYPTDNNYANSHKAHTATIECNACHGSVASAWVGNNRTIGDFSRHVDGARDVSLAGYNPTSRSCASTSCHGSSAPIWGAVDSLTCEGCHQSQGAWNGTGTRTFTSAHQRHTDSQPSLGYYNFACEVCHAWKATDNNATHRNGDNSSTTPRYVEVKFTDNATAQSYNSTWSFRSFNMRLARYNAAATIPNYVDNSVQGMPLDIINPSITWSTGSCGNVWCHSNANPASAGGGENEYKTPVWAAGSGRLACNSCHRGAEDNASMTGGSGQMSRGHRKHIATNLYAFTCDKCHANTVAVGSRGEIRADNTGLATHVNGTKNDNGVDIKGGVWTLGGTVDDSILSYDNAAKKCSSTYCHSQGTSKVAPFDNAVTTIAWDNAQGTSCTSCHGGDLFSGKPMSTGKHYKHLLQGYGCATCHNKTMDNSLGAASDNTKLNPATGYQYHVNGIVDKNSDFFLPGSCISVTCHSGSSYETTVWAPAATLPSCFDCHSGPYSQIEKLYKPQVDYDNAAIPNPVNRTEYGTTGHGRLTTLGNYPGGNNPPAGFDCVAVVDASHCYFCHSSTPAKHGTKDLNDPFRLGYGTDAAGQDSRSPARGAFADNTDDLCLKCHGAVTGGPPLAQVTRNMATHSKAITGGSKNWPGPNYPWKCVDCHDPHGDGNWKMIRSGINAPNSRDDTLVGSDSKAITRRPNVVDVKAVTFTSTAGYADNSYAIPGPGNIGICEVCHTQTTAFASSGTYVDNASNHGTRTDKCILCHVHTAAFRGLGGPDVGQYFDRLAFANYPDTSSHPLRGLTTADTTLRFAAQGSENCLGCHYGSGSGKTSDECLMCHFENVGSGGAPGALDATRHMDRQIQLATISGDSLPTSAYTIASIQNYDGWCLQCHGSESGITLGGISPLPSRRTVIDPAAFANGRHRLVNALKGGAVGCIYCHQPHGRSNTRIVRENPSNRASAGVTPMRFGAYPIDNVGGYTGKYRAVANDNYLYRARTDNTLPNVFSDADDDQNFCAKACHPYKTDPLYAKDKMIKRDGTTGDYILAGAKKIYIIGGAEYTVDNIVTQGAPTFHGHVDGDIIPTDNMVKDYASRIGMTGPSYYQYPLTTSANPAVYGSPVSDLPFFPDYLDGTRDFQNAYGYAPGVRIKYRFTCSTCHNPHGTTLANTGGTARGYPDLRLPKTSPSTLCGRCHK